jgi:hypothetical protein
VKKGALSLACLNTGMYNLRQIMGKEIPDEVFMVHGWDMNENMDEIDIVESSCFVSEAHANAELDRMKIVQPRDEWIINRWRIDETHWQEGFERV